MSEVTYLEAIKQGMREEMQRDQSVYILGEDVGVYGGAFKVTAGLLDEFGPLRVIDTPLSESAIVGAAVGSALMGQRPIAEMQFMDFIACGFDQIVNMAAKLHYRTGWPCRWSSAVRLAAACMAGRSTRRIRRPGSFIARALKWWHRVAPWMRMA